MVVELRETGLGDQTIVAGTEAEPAAVHDAMATVPPHGAWATDAKT